ncbi:MAG: Flp family type IVb pilin [Magnetospirillum sp. WYHS-4]
MARNLIQAATGLWKDESGATAIEYGLIAAGIAVAILVAITTVGNGLQNTFNNVSNKL